MTQMSGDETLMMTGLCSLEMGVKLRYNAFSSFAKKGSLFWA